MDSQSLNPLLKTGDVALFIAKISARFRDLSDITWAKSLLREDVLRYGDLLNWPK